MKLEPYKVMVLEAYPTEGTAVRIEGAGSTVMIVLSDCAALFGAIAPPELIEIAIVYDPGTTDTTTRRKVEFTTEHGAEMLFKNEEQETPESWLPLIKLLPITEIVLLKYPTTGLSVESTGELNTINWAESAIVKLKGRNVIDIPRKPTGVPMSIIIVALVASTSWQLLARVGPTDALHSMDVSMDVLGNMLPMIVMMLVA
jgi:hypothetical protein